MENKDKKLNSHEISIPRFEANMKKARLVSSILEKAEKDEEEANKGRS